MALRLRAVVATSTAVGLAIAATVFAAPAGAHTATLYVSPRGRGADYQCRHAGFHSIQAAVDAAPAGGTVVVCRGTYPGMVTISHRLTLAGRRGAVLDAAGMPYGVGTTASWVTITGLTVQGASPLNPVAGQLADGILTAGFGPNGPVAADHVRILGNTVSGNLGSGIDLNSTSDSIAVGNRAVGNGVGINVSDDLGRPAAHNIVAGNVTDKNFGGCGIALADHSGAGVIGNVVALNRSDDNGLATPTAPDASAGSGVILASAIPAANVSDNLIVGNEFHGNGHGGVVVHAHVPGGNFTGNSIIGNRIGTNNLRTDEADPHSTGIYLGDASPLTIRVIGNTIRNNHYGIFTAGTITITGGGNHFIHDTHRIGHAPGF
jgi:parallel beta-helix repeat (two copies)